MKTYCKNADIANVEFIETAILSYIWDKTRKGSTLKFYSSFSGKKQREIIDQMNPRSRFFQETTRAIAEEMAHNIECHTVKEHLAARCSYEPLIRYRPIIDKGSGKARTLGLETPLLRFYEVVADEGAQPLFKAKVGEYQIASIKGKGQSFGRKCITKWLSRDPEGTKFCVQADISKCYPSISHNVLRSMFQRDIRKSGDLLYLLNTIIDVYEECPASDSDNSGIGIIIGSPASKDFCNYYMSRLYHYASECLFKEKSRRGEQRRIRLISHIVIYADDILIYGGNKKDIQVAMRKIVLYAREQMNLAVKASWRKFRTMYKNAAGKTSGCLLDFIGTRFHGGEIATKEYFGRKVRYRKIWVTIRAKTFLKARRKLTCFLNKVKRKQKVSRRCAQGVTSYFGCFKSTNSVSYRKKMKIDQITKIARRIVSDYAKGKEYRTEQYFRIWRCYFA